jgi:hypothetical protein
MLLAVVVSSCSGSCEISDVRRLSVKYATTYSCTTPMPHTHQTTTNHTRQPVAMIVRSIETSLVSVPWANARMRGVVLRKRKVGGLGGLGGRRCAEFGLDGTGEGASGQVRD